MSARSKSAYIWFAYESGSRPGVKVVDQASQVMLAFLGHGEEHFSIHLALNYLGMPLRTDDPRYLATHFMPTWSTTSAVVDAARSMGLSDPERHQHYTYHQPIRNFDGQLFVGLGRRLEWVSLPEPAAKHAKARRFDIEVGAASFMFEMVALSTPAFPYTGEGLRIPVQIGEVVVRADPGGAGGAR